MIKRDRRDYNKQYYQNNQDKFKQYYLNDRDDKIEQAKKYSKYNYEYEKLARQFRRMVKYLI